MQRQLCGLITLLCLWSCLTATATDFEVSIQGADKDASQVVVRVPIDLDISTPCTVRMRGSHFDITGQVTKPHVLSSTSGWELCFVVPRLSAGQNLTLRGQVQTSPPQETRFGFRDVTGKYNELAFGKRPVLRYMYEAIDRTSPERIGETYKVFHHVYDPAGTRFLTKGPGGLFPHHRGLFFGFNRISYGDQQADIWHCRHGEHQAHTDFLNSVDRTIPYDDTAQSWDPGKPRYTGRCWLDVETQAIAHGLRVDPALNAMQGRVTRY